MSVEHLELNFNYFGEVLIYTLAGFVSCLKAEAWNANETAEVMHIPVQLAFPYATKNFSRWNQLTPNFAKVQQTAETACANGTFFWTAMVILVE